ncbi:MAG: ATP-binding protein [Nitrospinota bacterium]
MSFSSATSSLGGIKGQRLYVPVVGIILSVLILVIILAIFSYRSIHREGNLIERFLKREGISLVNSLEVAARMGLRLDPGEGQFQILVQELIRQDDILYVAIVDEGGRVIAHSDPSQVGGLLPLSNSASASREIADRLVHRKGKSVYEIRRAFHPRVSLLSEQSLQRGKSAAVIPPLPAERVWMVLGVDPQDYMDAKREDRFHAILMAAILFVVGAASLYFVIVVQNFSTVDRTLHRMQGYVRRILESLEEGLITLDGQGRVTTVNRAGSQLLGATPDQVQGVSHGDVFASRQNEGPASLMGLSSARNQEFRLRRMDGKTIPVSVTGSPLLESAVEGGGTVLLFRDLREVQRLQAEVTRHERLASVGRLAAGVAHEIRNPLSSIRGFAQYFQSKFRPDSDERGYAKTIVEEVDRLNRVVTELLDFARPLEPRFQQTDLEEVVGHALELVASQAQGRGVRIDLQNPQAPILHTIDPDQMVHALLNIFLNSLQAMTQGGTLSVRVGRSEEDGATISICDTGPGIPEEDLPRLFDPFFTTKPSGTGLGLAVVHRVIEAHDGDVQVESRPGEGTTVRVTLPPRP